MRRLFCLLALLLCSPVFALDWHVGVTPLVNEDENLETRVTFRVERFHFAVDGRRTDFGHPSLSYAVADKNNYPQPVAPAVPAVEFESGLQWRATAAYFLVKSGGPVVSYTKVNELDSTWAVGWHIGVGSE